MLPTEEEKNRIIEAQMANSDIPLGNAEQFLLTLASVVELEARLKLWLFKLDFDNNELVRLKILLKSVFFVAIGNCGTINGFKKWNEEFKREYNTSTYT
jgi:hypothetical protein